MCPNTINSRFETYGELSVKEAPAIEQNGRYSAQTASEKLILADVISKLDLRPNHSLLDIGCGLGTLLVPCSFLVNRVVGIDHPKVVERLSGMFKRDNCTLVGSNFLEVGDVGQFDRIVSYSVIQVMPNEESVMRFIDKALGFLARDGLMLIGDVSNVDKKKRFVQSKRGKAFQAQWEEKMKSAPKEVPTTSPNPTPVVEFNDMLVLKIFEHVRSKGYDVYILNQPQNLPFGNTREDILIVGPEYEDGCRHF